MDEKKIKIKVIYKNKNTIVKKMYSAYIDRQKF